MQTFLPYSNFDKTFDVLDYRRLGKQRIEAKQCLLVCYRYKDIDISAPLGMSEKYAGYTWTRFKNHPCAKMWVGHESMLFDYTIKCCQHWIDRGYNDNTLPLIRQAQVYAPTTQCTPPPWLGNAKFHLMHKRVLIAKKPDFYQSLWPDILPATKEKGRWPYIWPS